MVDAIKRLRCIQETHKYSTVSSSVLADDFFKCVYTEVSAKILFEPKLIVRCCHVINKSIHKNTFEHLGHYACKCNWPVVVYA